MKTLIHCRVCQHAPLIPYADLGHQPLANALLPPDQPEEPEPRYPLVLARCPACHLSQLTVVVDRDQLYRDYLYTSGHSAPWITHCQNLINALRPAGKFCVEIASNDGTMLGLLKTAGARVLGVEPARNLTQHYPATIPFLSEFWSDTTAEWVRTRYGHPHIIIAQNVFGHVDDVRGFLWGIKKALHKHGTAVLEMPYLYRMLATGEYPQIYHEHLSYWSLTPLVRIAKSVGLALMNVDPIDVHGGSMRYFLQHGSSDEPSRRVTALLRMERDLQDDPELYSRLDVPGQVAQSAETLERYRGKVVIGYGATAKAAVLLNLLPNANIIRRIVDDNPLKQGHYMPGVRIPIVGPYPLEEANACVVLAWNWSEAIMKRAVAEGFGRTKPGVEWIQLFGPTTPNHVSKALKHHAAH